MLEKTIESFKRYINSQEQKLDDYYRMDEEFYKDEIEQLELSLKLLRTILNHLTKQDKMIELIEKECRQRLAVAKRIRRSEKRNPDDFNQGLEFESATIMNLLSGEPHWEYEGKYFDDIDKQVEKLKAEEAE